MCDGVTGIEDVKRNGTEMSREAALPTWLDLQGNSSCLWWGFNLYTLYKHKCWSFLVVILFYLLLRQYVVQPGSELSI